MPLPMGFAGQSSVDHGAELVLGILQGPLRHGNLRLVVLARV